MTHCQILLPAFIIIIVAFSGGCLSSILPTDSHPSPVSLTPAQPVNSQTLTSSLSGAFTIRIDSLDNGAVLPDAYTCKGSGESPAVSWDGIPNGTKSLVLIVDDPDAPGGRFTHWIVYNIPPESTGLARAQPIAKVLANGAQQGDTSTGSRGYYPPCPPIGATHRYIFRLFAVDMDITQPTADRESIDWALTGHTLAETRVTTTFKR